MIKHRLHRLEKQITQILLFAVYCLLFTAIVYAQSVSSAELIEKAAYYNNKTVEYQGEVVGDVMVRKDFAWVNLNDGKNAIGVWGKRDLISGLIKYKGDYNYKGDTILIEGIFHRACPQHGGDLDIHLIEAIKIKEGFLIKHPVSLAKILNALLILLLALGLFVLCAIKRKRS